MVTVGVIENCSNNLQQTAVNTSETKFCIRCSSAARSELVANSFPEDWGGIAEVPGTKALNAATSGFLSSGGWFMKLEKDENGVLPAGVSIAVTLTSWVSDSHQVNQQQRQDH